MQLVLGYTPMQVGLSFLPANVIMAIFSLGLSARLVMRHGTRTPLALGLLLAAIGLALFARAPLDGQFIGDILPGMLLLGLGAGMAFNPMLLTAMSEVEPKDSGLASGVVNTSFMMGGSVGLAVLASVAAYHTRTAAPDLRPLVALNDGYQVAFLIGAGFALTAAVLAALLLRSPPTGHQESVDSAAQSTP
jgi:MFS family permease